MAKEEVIANVRRLYANDENAKIFLDWMASKERDRWGTSIDTVIDVIDDSRQEAYRLLAELEEAGCGTVKRGRRGSKTRIEWAYSRVELGRAAAGEIEEVDEIDQDAMDPDEGAEEAGVTVPEAKRLLALTLGVDPEQIEITITA